MLKQPNPFFMSDLIHNTSSNIVCKKAVLEKGDKFAARPDRHRPLSDRQRRPRSS